jgi:hypothetical protein
MCHIVFVEIESYAYEFRFSKEESMVQQISLEFGKNMKMGDNTHGYHKT